MWTVKSSELISAIKLSSKLLTLEADFPLIPDDEFYFLIESIWSVLSSLFFSSSKP